MRLEQLSSSAAAHFSAFGVGVGNERPERTKERIGGTTFTPFVAKDAEEREEGGGRAEVSKGVMRTWTEDVSILILI